MNIFDCILFIAIIICIVGGIAVAILGIKDSEGDMIAGGIIGGLLLAFLVSLPLLVIDRHSGSTSGIITSVDKNFFGTTALYIKTTETNEEEYCIEFDKKLEKQAKNYIGKKVKITYGKRVGFYSTGKCHQSPVKTIELVNEEEK